MTYRAKPVTQRDGSALANSNCRMASIATGLDYQTLGARTSTGSKMRSYQDDQSGGTDSGDADRAWANGYDQDLRVMDGHTFADALADLRAGRLVHLDVWAAKVGQVCISGTGGYGHTIAVAPEYQDGKWLVADPWCSPPKWSWVAESALRSGAEYWGGQVYSLAADEADYPSGGPGPRDPRVLAIVARIVKRLMTQYDPGKPARVPPGRDTGGGAVLYTTTKVQTASGGPEMIHYSPRRWKLAGGTDFYDAPGGTRIGALSSGQTVEATTLGGALTASGGIDWDWLPVLIDSSLPSGERAWKVLWIEHPGGSPLGPAPDWSVVVLDTMNDYQLVRYPDGGDGGGGDDLGSRQAQYDADARALLGARPTS